ncbi:MAG TPA: hypothetical protein ENI33_05750 [Thermoplasmatales archaeon]|nr:hypothetical protein [Thermoplasmatales archaeon]
MISDFLSERPTEKITKYLLFFSFPLVVITVSTVMYLLKLSNFPGTLNETQLGFNGEYIKSCFSRMSDEDMSIFIIANILDYAFMIAYGTFFFSLALTLTRKLKEGSIWKKIGYSISIFGITDAFCDGIENIFLLMMALNPVNFPNWWAIAHSSFALAKFIQMYAAMGGIILMALVIVLSRLIKRNNDKGGR